MWFLFGFAACYICAAVLISLAARDKGHEEMRAYYMNRAYNRNEARGPFA